MWPVGFKRLKQLGWSGNISTHLKQFSASADDTLITTRTKQSLTDNFKKSKNKSIHSGLIESEQKINI